MCLEHLLYECSNNRIVLFNGQSHKRKRLREHSNDLLGLSKHRCIVCRAHLQFKMCVPLRFSCVPPPVPSFATNCETVLPPLEFLKGFVASAVTSSHSTSNTPAMCSFSTLRAMWCSSCCLKKICCISTCVSLKAVALSLSSFLLSSSLLTPCAFNLQNHVLRNPAQALLPAALLHGLLCG